LYGATSGGGTAGYGTIFELSPSGFGWTESVLYNFQGGTDGYDPNYAVSLDAEGNIWGMTDQGGDETNCAGFGCGTIFELTPNGSGGWNKTTVYTFTGPTDGKQPYSNLLFDAKGNFYGLTNGGGTGTGCGSYGCGTAFEMSPSTTGWTFTVLHTFSGGSDGAYPNGNLVFDAAGDIYGAASNGGSTTSSYCASNSGCGTIFRFSPAYNGRQFRVLYAFTGPTGFPLGSLAIDHSGNLYGSTYGGTSQTCRQTSGCGVVFQLSPTTQRQWKLTVLHSFSGNLSSDQYDPNPVIVDASGNVFGTTQSGGYPNLAGTAFELSPTTTPPWAYTRLFKFAGTSGDTPYENLIEDASGNLYGTTYYGGNGAACSSFGCGAVFELSPASSKK